MTATRPRRALTFAGFALLAVLLEWTLARSPAFARGPVPFAILFDCVVVLPLAFAVFVLRPAGRSLLQAVPLLALGSLVAGFLLRGRPETRWLMQGVGVFVEVTVLAALGRRVVVARRELRTADGDDVLLQMGAITDPVLRALGLELAVLYYGVVGWRVRRTVRPNEYSYVAESGVGGLLFALGLVVACEGFAVHFLLHAWSARVAWLHAAGNVYALVWLAAAYQAGRLRPVVLTESALLVRTSLLQTVTVPRALIAQVGRRSEIPRDAKILRAAFGTTPELLVTLREPVVAHGLLGLRKQVTAIALYVDDVAGLHRALTEALPADTG